MCLHTCYACVKEKKKEKFVREGTNPWPVFCTSAPYLDSRFAYGFTYTNDG